MITSAPLAKRSRLARIGRSSERLLRSPASFIESSAQGQGEGCGWGSGEGSGTPLLATPLLATPLLATHYLLLQYLLLHYWLRTADGGHAAGLLVQHALGDQEVVELLLGGGGPASGVRWGGARG